jgi:hypothetical protein
MPSGSILPRQLVGCREMTCARLGPSLPVTVSPRKFFVPVRAWTKCLRVKVGAVCACSSCKEMVQKS